MATIPKRSKPGLMDLPPELRWHIYSYLLRPGHRLVIDDVLLPQSPGIPAVPERTVYEYREGLPDPLLMSLSYSIPATYKRSYSAERARYGRTLEIRTNVLLVSRQIRDEALPCLYGQHLHFACSPQGVEAFLKDRAESTWPAIQHITLTVPSEGDRLRFDGLCSYFLARELQLRKLHVRINTFQWKHNPFEGFERENWGSREFLKHDWVQALVWIKNLGALHIEINDRYVWQNRAIQAEVMKLLGARMLKLKTHRKFKKCSRVGKETGGNNLQA